MDETAFHTLADARLQALAAQLEVAYENGTLEEVELQGGILTIKSEHRTFVVSKHAPSMQMWYASPLSGGLHFRYDAENKRWTLPDGRELETLLIRELTTEGAELSI